MSKYKVGDKVFFEGVIIDTEANSTFPYRVKFSDGSDEIFREEILCFFNTYEDGYKDGYKKGKKEALMEVVNCEDAKYNQGLNDAWELARKIVLTTEMGGICYDDFKKIFGVGNFVSVLRTMTAQQALAKIDAYEKSQQIQVGDVVKVKDETYEFVVTALNGMGVQGIGSTGNIFTVSQKGVEKTGRHIDIEHLLEQIRGNE